MYIFPRNDLLITLMTSVMHGMHIFPRNDLLISLMTSVMHLDQSVVKPFSELLDGSDSWGLVTKKSKSLSMNTRLQYDVTAG